MFGIGWSELAVIVCIAIIFIHPKDLPALFRKLGKAYAQAKKIYAEIVSTKDKFVKDIENAATLEDKPTTPSADSSPTEPVDVPKT
jgi:sec-independent protein translocase protein TatB